MGRMSWTSTMPKQHQCKSHFLPVIQTNRNLAVPSGANISVKESILIRKAFSRKWLWGW